MIYHTLTDAQMKKSQWLYIGYNLLNGVGYMCVGDTVMLLLVHQLGFPDVVFTIMSQMMNIGCLWLPLGKIATRHWGAARTQSNFWFFRNCAALIMGSCAIWAYFGHIYIAGASLLIGAFLFYGCRSAGTVMTTALVGNITREGDRGKIIAFAQMGHHIMSPLISVSLMLLTRYSQSIWVLFGIVVFGVVCGMLSALCLHYIDESDALKEAAKKPLISDAWTCLKSSAFRRMVIAQLCFSIGMTLTTSLGVLVQKRGWGMPNDWIFGFSIIGSLIYVALARLGAWVGDKLGPRKGMICGYCFIFLIVLAWHVLPSTFHWWAMVIMTVLSCCCSILCGICSQQYFLKCIPVEHQPSAATLQMLINGLLTGFIGMAITSLLWFLCDRWGGDLVGMARYRFFFRLGLPVVALCFLGVCMQKEV